MQRLLAPALAVILALPLQAQGVGGYGDRDRYGTANRVPKLPTPTHIAGPMTPETLRQLLNLDSTQVANLTPLYAAHLEATLSTRDSAAAHLDMVPETLQRGEREQVSRLVRTLQSLGRALEKADKEFEEKTLKPLLSKDQWEGYKRYTKERLKAASDEQQERLSRLTRGGRS